MHQIRTYVIIAIVFIILSVMSGYLFGKKTKNHIQLFILIGLLLLAAFSYFFVSPKWLYVFGGSLLIGIIYRMFEGGGDLKGEYQIVLKHGKGVLKFNNPFTGFLGYGGAGSGKTASLGKPLLSEFMRNQFALFVYDAKENDYTRTAFWLKEKLNYPYPIYNIDFSDLSRSYRFNPIHVNLIEDESEVSEIATMIYKTFAKKASLNEWDDKALGLFKGIAYYIYKYNPECFTIPHILNMITQNEGPILLKLLKDDPTCRSYAKSLIDSQGSEATMSSILSTLSGVISNFAANKKWCWILSGNDFEYNLTDPENPKGFFITNTFKFREQISPMISLFFVMAMKKVQFGNKVPICAFLDEATTFKIEDLEAYPAELREYLLAMVVLTQSPSKIEKLYGKHDRASLESNLQNQFFFRTKDNLALDVFTNIFSKKKEKESSVTKGTVNENVSTTTRTKDVKRYEKDFFINMKQGQVVGTATDSNVKEFNVRLKQFEGEKLNLNPLVQMVSNEDVDSQYLNIMKEISYTN